MLLSLLVPLLCTGLCAGSGERFNCTESTCASISCCSDPSGKNCPSSNCTASQLPVPDPRKPCGCCQRCIDQQAENEECDIDNSDNFGDIPAQMCGHGLTCTPVGSTGFCRSIVDTQCKQQQRKYDQESLRSLIPGKLRPLCDAEGKFQPAQRQPGLTSGCYSEEGERIYGERGSTEDGNMGCQCARLHHAPETIQGLDRRPHCMTDGNYDELQCNNITCFCVDALNGNITSPIASWPFKDLLACFNESIHRTDYLKPCELVVSELEEEKEEWAKLSFSLAGEETPNCDIGGYFDKVQDSHTRRYCVAPDGTALEGYSVPRSSPAADSMTCNCARSSFHMTAAGQMTDLPQCCDNGDFRPYQCRGLYCYCVDAEGRQYGSAQPQSSLQKLTCSTKSCPSAHPQPAAHAVL